MRATRDIRLFGRPYQPLTLAAVIGIGVAGAVIANLVGTPLPFLFGSTLAVGAAAIAGLRVCRAPLAFPTESRNFFVPVIGVSIGGAFTPGLIEEAQVWALSLLTLLLYVPMVHWAGYLLCRRLGGLSPATAWFGSMPGGFVEAIQMGEENGANMAILSAIQFLRLILCILLIPLGFSLVEGVAVGSAAGVTLPGAGLPLSARDAAVLILCGVAGYGIGRLSRLPAGIITGPLLLSGAAHLLGLVEGQVPGWCVAVTQFVIGLTLGVRFAGIARGELLRALGLAALIVAGTLALAGLCGLAFGPLVDEPVEAVILAFAPGGLVEMSLVALSLQVSALYVTAHHVLRIILAVAFGRLGWSFVRPR